jgi:hypothetical protein
MHMPSSPADVAWVERTYEPSVMALECTPRGACASERTDPEVTQVANVDPLLVAAARVLAASQRYFGL